MLKKCKCLLKRLRTSLKIYNYVYRLCLNVEDVMGLFSEELRMLDRNTTQFMIDTMQEKIDDLQGTVDE